MVEELLTDTKLIPIPKPLANQLRLLAGRLGVSVASLTEKAIEQVLRADTLGTNVKDAVDILHIDQANGMRLISQIRSMVITGNSLRKIFFFHGISMNQISKPKMS